MKPLCPLAARICEVYNYPPIMFAEPVKEPPKLTPRQIEQARRAELFRRNEAALAKMRGVQPIEPKRDNKLILKSKLPSGNMGKAVMIVATHFDVDAGGIVSKSRKEEYKLARLAVVLIARDDFKLSYPRIATHLNRDHSTIIHAYNKGMDALFNDMGFALKFAKAQSDVRKVARPISIQSGSFQNQRNEDIKRRLRAGDTPENIGKRYGLAPSKVLKIGKLGE